MVGIVLISHSPQLAVEVAELAAQIGGRDVPIAAAGGTDDGRLGTSITKVADAIATVDQGDGVILLMDLGSAVLTAKTLLDEHPRPRVFLADAPFVEGAISALVTSGGGADVKAVLTAAEEARHIGKL
ncbi:dihydroxyacetone kinase phosphoryl donor subunit DhaM [Acrocarpospora pleiomorpha]|uniref:phosphoenolpyruvate--glycerone phosphotransferase n=1 Tax=Acrocarpospora pleiomorpha TaxID=90975 RepID=A0A5M3XIK0_9ACTN|nr:dihydroxyacetone kinase phosphoryl donor subunit DhaM [Acrocarpospora pleiomorpha]GES17878.1 PTS fructose transporter subunit IIA [Acrocarpospora pleiomorpha]